MYEEHQFSDAEEDIPFNTGVTNIQTSIQPNHHQSMVDTYTDTDDDDDDDDDDDFDSEDEFEYFEDELNTNDAWMEATGGKLISEL
jgi:hypothetical protein